MSPLNKPEGPSFKDIYEMQTKTDARISRLEKGFLVLVALMFTKQAAPAADPAKLVSLMQQFLT